MYDTFSLGKFFFWERRISFVLSSQKWIHNLLPINYSKIEGSSLIKTFFVFFLFYFIFSMPLSASRVLKAPNLYELISTKKLTFGTSRHYFPNLGKKLSFLWFSGSLLMVEKSWIEHEINNLFSGTEEHQLLSFWKFAKCRDTIVSQIVLGWFE